MKNVVEMMFDWYRQNARTHLPWRKTRNPYRILVSEIMLQQTQVDRVIEKYKAFLKAFPTAKALANAKTADVIRAWKGLGYNRRALYLQKTAQAIVTEHKGRFPRDLETLKTLPGVGDYTARAILSFAFEQRVPMMDTNHRRVYGRIFFGVDIPDDKTLLEKADKVVSHISKNRDEKAIYDWNSALMDFGSAICTTRMPKCEQCPVKKWCKAYPDITKKQQSIESKKTKRTSVPFKETDRYVRGRIMDMLREQGSVSSTTARRRFAELPIVRYRSILQKLEKDGLIEREKGRILLP